MNINSLLHALVINTLQNLFEILSLFMMLKTSALKQGIDFINCSTEQKGTVTRLFSLNITFQQQLYTALVSIWQEGRNLYCQVRYTDKDLQSLLPDGKLIFNLSETQTELPHFSSALTDELVNNTNKAINEYLHLKTT